MRSDFLITFLTVKEKNIAGAYELCVCAQRMERVDYKKRQIEEANEKKGNVQIETDRLRD